MAVLVIARYQENIDWIKDITIPIVVYNKFELSNIPNVTEHLVPNIGREAESYIRYIIDNYNDLPDKVFFTQGHPFDHSPDFINIINIKLKENWDFCSLASMSFEYPDECFHHSGIELGLKYTFIDLFGFIPNIYNYPTGALFGLSRETIKKHSINTWKYIHKKIIDSTKIPNCRYDFHPQKPCGCLNPYSAWCIERIWYYFSIISTQTPYEAQCASPLTPESTT